MGHIMLLGLVLAILLLTLKGLRWKFLILDSSTEFYTLGVAVIFMALGMWISARISKPGIQTLNTKKEQIPDPPKLLVPEEVKIKNIELSRREYEVLHCLAKGQSNAEIAKSHFLSVSTVKTHVSNLCSKLGVKSRTQASVQARKDRLIE